MTDSISASVFCEKLKTSEKCYVLDIRTLFEYRNEHLKYPAIHLPMDQISGATLSLLMPDKERPVYLFCRSGARAFHIAKNVMKEGYKRVLVVENGIIGCRACGAELESDNN